MTKPSRKREQRASANAVYNGDSADRARAERESPAERSKRAVPPKYKPSTPESRARNKPKGQHGVPGSKDPARRCTATANRTGERCKAPAIKGGNVCRMHGGALPQVKKKAAERLQEMVEPALVELNKILARADTSDADKLRAIQMVLDRTGFRPGVEITVGVSKFEETQYAAFTGVDRSLIGLDESDKRPALGVGGGESDDLDQAQHDANAEAWRELDAEDEHPYATRLDPYGANVVRGEVVNNDPPDYSRARGTR